MIADPIVEEVYQIRELILKECDGDLEKLMDRIEAAEKAERDFVLTDKVTERKRSAKNGHVARSSPNLFRDPIVEEVHRIREQIWEECDRDWDMYFQRLKEAEKQHSDRLVSSVKSKTKPKKKRRRVAERKSVRALRGIR